MATRDDTSQTHTFSLFLYCNHLKITIVSFSKMSRLVQYLMEKT